MGFIALLCFVGVHAQEEEALSKKELNEANNLTFEGNERIAEKDFVSAEAKYRESISMNPKVMSSKYNLGNAYYNQQALDEAVQTFVKAGKTAETDLERHQPLHNLGNTMMLKKDYAKAVEAYKDALRNNPEDDETRYNLALAKKLLENQKEQEKQDKNKDKDKEKDQNDQNDENKDPKENKDKGDQQKDDQGDQQKGDDKEDENGDPKEDQGGEKEEQKKGDGDKKKEQPQQPNEQQPPRKSELSPQQIKNLLEAVQNEEKKSKEKMDAQKVKKVQVKAKKDW